MITAVSVYIFRSCVKRARLGTEPSARHTGRQKEAFRSEPAYDERMNYHNNRITSRAEASQSWQTMTYLPVFKVLLPKATVLFLYLLFIRSTKGESRIFKQLKREKQVRAK